jgi:hypothetical protein
MSNLITEFELECAGADIPPVAALVEAGLHRSTWFRWKSGGASPTLRSLSAARDGLHSLVEKRNEAARAA